MWYSMIFAGPLQLRIFDDPMRSLKPFTQVALENLPRKKVTNFMLNNKSIKD